MKEKFLTKDNYCQEPICEKEVSFSETSGFYFFCVLILTFLLSIGQTKAQCTLQCTNTDVNPPIEYAVNQNCGGLITPNIALDDEDNCLGPLLVTLLDTLGNPIAGSPNINVGLLDSIIVVKVTDQASGNMCQSRIHIVDHLPPSFSGCPDSVYVNIGCNARTDTVGVPPPAVTDNCDSELDLTYTEDIVGVGILCSDPYSAILRRFWIAEDDFGNSDSCLQIIRLTKATLDDVSFSFSTTMPINVDCALPVDINDLAFFGQPMVDGQPLVNGTFCELHAHYVDDTLSSCSPASFSVIRTWTVLDQCNTDNETIVQQVINFVDNTPPVITCPPMLTVNTSPLNCTATVVLPQAMTTDNCSPFRVTPSWNYGTGIKYGFGPHLNVPVGDHTVTYTARDSCNNSSSCTMTVRVRDEISPTPVCLEYVVVSLPDGGATYVPAASFDNGSHDNCAVLSLLVRRMDTPAMPFGPSIPVDCDDIAASPIMVILKVTDIYNNMNTCMVELTVQDGVPPVMICPADMTVSCSADLTNQAIYGASLMIDNCSATVDSTFVIDVENCGTGTVTRTFTATDSKGNTDRCTQHITVVNDDPFTVSDITWPPMYATNACITPAYLDPQDLPAPFNYPVFANHPCALLATNYTDQILVVAQPACYKILRKWIVIDWCQYDEDVPGQGIWQHTQILQVMDNTAPVITCPANITITNNAACNGNNVSIPLATVTDGCSTQNSIVNDHNNGGANASGYYPNGVTTVKFTAEDGCGNTAFCTFTVTVTDLTPPAAVCKEGLSANLVNMGNGQIMTMLQAITVSASSYDNCTDDEDLIFRIRKTASGGTGVPATSVISFDCTEQGMNDIQLWVVDEAGNASYCTTFIDVQDNMDMCPPVSAAQATIAGAVQTLDGESVEQVTVAVLGEDMMPCITGTSGSFTFDDLSTGEDYTIMPEKDINPLNGVTTYDIVVLQKHILGISPLPSPYKIIAADINHSNSVTAFDMVELRKVILHINDVFPNNHSWRFVKSDYVFPNPQNPFVQDFPEEYEINDLPTGTMLANFVGIKIGDLNGNATGSELMAGDDRNGDVEQHNLYVDDQSVEAGEIFTVYLKSKDFRKVEGMQFSLQFDPEAVTFEDITSGVLSEKYGLDASNFGIHQPDKGVITLSWTGLLPTGEGISVDTDAPLTGIQFKANRALKTSEVLKLSQLIHPEIYQQEAGETVVKPIALVFGERGTSLSLEEGFALFQNYPNPFTEATMIGFSLPEAGEATLVVYDLAGRIIWQTVQQFTAGYHEIGISAKDLPAQGAYYYQLSTAGDTAVKRMVKGG
jgi:hypothetical protein